MRRDLLPAGLILLAATPAMAQETAPPADITLSGGAGVTSDYRYRGLSQSGRRVAVQGFGRLDHISGAYAMLWVSSIDDDYVRRGAGAELDLSAGYRRTLHGTTIDGGVRYYIYPGAASSGRVRSDVVEPYLSATHTIGPIAITAGGNAAWRQHALGLPPVAGRRGRGGAYGYAELAAAIPTTPFTLTGHVGRSFVRNFMTYGRRYTDWRLTAAYVVKRLTLSVSYVDTDIALRDDATGRGFRRDIARGGIVGTVAASF